MASEAPKKKRAPGRESLLTPDVHSKIVALVRMGMSPTSAVVSLGIASDTYLLWKRKARAKTDEKYVRLLVDVEKAKQLCIADLLHTVRQSAQTDTDDAKWLLERLARKRFGKEAPTKMKSSVISTPTGPALQIILQPVDDDDVEGEA